MRLTVVSAPSTCLRSERELAFLSAPCRQCQRTGHSIGYHWTLLEALRFLFTLGSNRIFVCYWSYETIRFGSDHYIWHRQTQYPTRLPTYFQVGPCEMSSSRVTTKAASWRSSTGHPSRPTMQIISLGRPQRRSLPVTSPYAWSNRSYMVMSYHIRLCHVMPIPTLTYKYSS